MPEGDLFEVLDPERAQEKWRRQGHAQTGKHFRLIRSAGPARRSFSVCTRRNSTCVRARIEDVRSRDSSIPSAVVRSRERSNSPSISVFST